LKFNFNKKKMLDSIPDELLKEAVESPPELKARISSNELVLNKDLVKEPKGMRHSSGHLNYSELSKD